MQTSEFVFRPARLGYLERWHAAFSRNPGAFGRLMDKTDTKNTAGCWINRFAKNTFKYGQVDVKGCGVRCNRLMWTLWWGPIPKGMCVCHKCDTPACVNPYHLYIGSHKDNMADRERKGRTVIRRGPNYHSAKLAEGQVRAIRASKAKGVEIARRYNVSPATVCNIRKNKIWTHVK